MSERDSLLLERVLLELAGSRPAATVVISGRPRVLPSVYNVTALACASVGAATASVAAVLAARAGAAIRTAYVDREHASVAFRSERYLEPLGWTLPPVWDPIAGDYKTADGWIRLHTNYAYHRAAVVRVLGTGASRETVASAALSWTGNDLEDVVVAE